MVNDHTQKIFYEKRAFFRDKNNFFSYFIGALDIFSVIFKDLGVFTYINIINIHSFSFIYSIGHHRGSN